ncbi:choline dehydrogenase [Pigmentiphaga soli]|uniref:Choline dehydrogenase n=1 Tax=Pigmentiphaga soli TaxID=1007095 RepID=A0ABP8HP00_9BURK
MRGTEGYDYVIVGAGSAGCVLADRLTEDGSASVLLVEAGGWDRDPFIKIPIGWGRLMQKRLHDWGYDTEPDAALGGRTMECTRGRVIGGSSSINAMAYVRGNPGDYDRWAGYGLPGWSYAHVLPYFKRQERWQDGESLYRGGSGPLSTVRASYRDPLSAACLEAADSAGFPRTDDYNGARQEGFGILQSTIGKGRRCSAADAYLRPALGRANLTVATGALVTGIAFEGERAVAVEYRRGGRARKAAARREIILCAGTMNTPQILMLSGIGDPAELARHGIRTRVALPGVGANLQDHLTVAVEFRRRESGPFVHHMRADRLLAGLGQAYLRGTGFATDLPSGWTAFLRTPLAGALPDIQLIFRAVPMAAAPWFPGVRKPFEDGFAVRAVLVRPESRGRVALRSADPADKIMIRQNLLSAGRDRAVMRAALRLIRELAAQPALRRYIGAELAPGEANWSDAGLDRHIDRYAATAHHPAGTCRMGGGDDPGLVLDPAFRVRGTAGLRVVDASAFPDLVGGNINAPVLMMAEKAADLILGREPPAPIAARTQARTNTQRQYQDQGKKKMESAHP